MSNFRQPQQQLQELSLSKIDDNFLTCSICTLLYSSSSDKDQSRAPKTLYPCGHTFCRNCIAMNLERCPPADFICFVCRTPTPLDKTLGADTIKTNFMVQELVATFHPAAAALTSSSSSSTSSSSETVFKVPVSGGADDFGQVCENCPQDENTPPAVSFCVQCEFPYCAICGDRHLKSKRGTGHELIPFASSTVEKEKKMKASRMCNMHKKEEVKFICESCGPNVFYCSICIVDSDHQEKSGHKLSSIEKYVSKQMEQLRLACDESEGLLKGQKDLLAVVDASIERNRNNCEASRAKIISSIDRLHEILNGIRDAWLAEVDVQGNSNAVNLSADKKMIQIHIGNGELSIGRANDMLMNLADIEFIKQSANLMQLLKETNDALRAPFTITSIALATAATNGGGSDGGVVDDFANSMADSDLAFSITSLLHLCPFQLPPNERLTVAARRVRGHCRSLLLTSSFNEVIMLPQRPQSYTFGNTNGVLSSIYITGLCYSEGGGVSIRGGEAADVVSASDGPSIFVGDSSYNRIQVLDPISGILKRTICGGGRGSGPNQLNIPHGICLGPNNITNSGSGGNNNDVDELHHHSLLYIADCDNKRVQVLNSVTGALVGTIGGNEQGSWNEQLSAPTVVCIGPSISSNLSTDHQQGRAGGEIFVVDNGYHRIQVFKTTSLAYVRTIGGGLGSGPGQLNHPFGACLSNSSSNASSSTTSSDILLFVSDNSNHRISVFNSATGAFLRTIGTGHGSGPGQLSFPLGVYYLPPTGGIAATRAALGGGGGGGEGAGSNSNLHSSNDSPALLFVADQNNKRVAVFNATSGAHVRNIDIGYNPQFVLPVLTPNGDCFLYVSTTCGGYLKIVRYI